MVAILVSRNGYPGSELAKGASSFEVSGLCHTSAAESLSVW
jgi:hypothetical protein